jgi:FkbH-like protein
MTARVRPIDATNLERSVQLIHRSNQFNLTTRRRTAAEVLAITADPAWLTLTVSLADRFGDNGLISVLLARTAEEALEIDTWLMSCRVLKRGVERFLLERICREALARGLRTVRGEYLPTSKNALVRRHYADLGFTQIAGSEEGPTRWELALSGDEIPSTTHITEIT